MTKLLALYFLLSASITADISLALPPPNTPAFFIPQILPVDPEPLPNIIGPHPMPLRKPSLSECRTLMDVVVVIDGSDSITAGDYDLLRDALARMVPELHLGPHNVRVGFVVYSSTIAQIVDITHDQATLVKAARGLLHPRDGTRTDLGIETMRQMLAKDGRSGVPWVCIVITDGISKDPKFTEQQANLAKSERINMFAVGVSKVIIDAELIRIASTPDQVLKLTTFKELRTSLSNLMQVVCPCPAPLPIMNAFIVDDSIRAIGTTLQYVCEKGFHSMGDNTITCMADSSWSISTFSCAACTNPMEFAGNAILLDGPNFIGSVREYACKKGFTSPFPPYITCEVTPSGPAWTPLSTVCNECPDPDPYGLGYLDSVVDRLIGTVRRIECNPGYIETGPITIQCIDVKGIAQWTKPAHTCIACGPAPQLANSVIVSSGFLIGSKSVYECIPGFIATGLIEAMCFGDKSQGATFWKRNEHKCIACKMPPHIPKARLLEPGDSLVGTTRKYDCVQGYQETGPILATCVGDNYNAYWVEPTEMCVACVAPPPLQNALLVVPGDTLVGSERNYICKEGFIASGPIRVGCIPGLGGPIWTETQHQCIACPPPPSMLPNAQLDPIGLNLVGQVRLYYCLKGFVASIPGAGIPGAGPVKLQCIGQVDPDGMGKAFWSPPSHECIVSGCGPLPYVPNAEPEQGDHFIGLSRRYICNKGFYETGNIVAVCLDNGQWSLNGHDCSSCGPVYEVPNAILLPGPHTVGTIRNFECMKGFVPDGKAMTTCGLDFLWTSQSFSCVSCKDPYRINHAILEPGDNLFNTVRHYTCLPGYLATGPIKTTCYLPGNNPIPDWSTPVHFCKDCGEPFAVEKASYKPGGPSTVGSMLEYMCIDGFVPTGPTVVHCMQNAEWSPPNFKCIDKDKLGECMAVIGEMFKVKFHLHDYCVKPISDNTLNGKKYLAPPQL